MREGSWPGPGQLGAMGEGSEDARQAGREAAAGGISIRPARPPRSEQLVPTRALPRAWVRDGGAGQRSTKSGLRPPAPVLRRCPSAPLAHGYPPHGSPTLHPGTSAAVGCGPRTAALALRPSHYGPRTAALALRPSHCGPRTAALARSAAYTATEAGRATPRPAVSSYFSLTPTDTHASTHAPRGGDGEAVLAQAPVRAQQPPVQPRHRLPAAPSAHPAGACHVPQGRVTSLSDVSRPSAASHVP